jgi:hypothetical protein
MSNGAFTQIVHKHPNHPTIVITQHHQSITKRTAQNIISINGGMTMINTSGVGLNLLIKVTFTSKNTLLMLA